MVSPTPNKALVFAAHGGSINSWDTQLNFDIETLDTILGGTLSQSLAAGSVVLSVSQAYNLSYTLTGLLVGNVTVTWPAVGGFYLVSNETTGSFSVTLLASGGGTSVAIPQGYKLAVWVNSAAPNDMSVFANAVVGNGTVVGNWAVTGNLTSSATDFSALATGTTAQRPAGLTAGRVRFNTTTGLFEVADGTAFFPVSIGQPVAAGFKNLTITNNTGTPNSLMDITADAVTLENSSGTAFRVSTVSLSPSSAASGANGLDTGVVAASTWYSIWVIYNPTTATTAGLYSIQSTANATFLSNLPAGYTFYARLGWNRTDSSNRFLRILQKGRDVQYVVSSAITTALPLMGSGATGSVSVPTWVAVAVANFVPTTAAGIKVHITGNSGTIVIAAPNNNYGAFASTTNPPPLAEAGAATVSFSIPGLFLLESTNIYWASNQATGYLYCFGWQDNI